MLARQLKPTILQTDIRGLSLHDCVWYALAQFVHVTATCLHIASIQALVEFALGIATPDKLKTRLGTLTSFDGVPDAKTT
jgi:hypothetical protein